MESLISIQDDLKSKISKARINFKKSPKDRITISYVEARLENLEKAWSRFTDTHAEIVKGTGKTELLRSTYVTTDMYDVTEESYIDYKSELKDMLKELTGGNGASIGNSKTNSQSIQVKLPKISLPVFTGKYSEWISFRDLFTSLVHNNNTLDDVQRLHYLKSHLVDEPEQLLRHVPITQGNYKVCWEQLEKRYNNKRFLANSILKRFMSQRSLSTESSYAIKELLDTTSECLHALENLGIDIKSWDIIVIYIICLKLDTESRKLWEVKISETCDELPTLGQFKEFLETRFRSLEFLDNKINKPTSSNRIQKSIPKSLHVSTAWSCAYCSENHKLYNCKKFAKENLDTRRNFVQTSNLCFNCLGSKHSAISCHQTTRCRLCRKKHHSLLHPRNVHQSFENDAGNIQLDSNVEPTTSSTRRETGNVVTCFSKVHSQVLLATALVNVTSKAGTNITLRSLLDQGSQASFITEAAVQLLGLKKFSSRSQISGLGSDQMGSVPSKFVVFLKIQSLHDPNFVVDVKAHVLKKLTTFLPERKVVLPASIELSTLELADPSYTVPNKIDLLLGAEIYGQILQEGLIKGASESLIVQKTKLGWIISGQIKTSSNDEMKSCYSVVSLHSHYNDNELLRKFWELESDISNQDSMKHFTPEEQRCEELFNATTVRDASGRFVVKLPFRVETPCRHGNSRDIAARRFYLLEKRLLKDPNLKLQYSNVIQEYLDLGHMEVVPEEERDNPNAVYLPHHPVIREDKTTTRTRVVFDASCKDSNGISLNSKLMIGPTLQSDLRHLILRWRLHPICLVADITKMYRQVKVFPEDADYQRILWRNPDQPEYDLQHYRLLTVTFGTASAPHLAVKALQQAAKDDGVHYPLASERVLKDFYIDDLLTGCENVEEGVRVYEEIKELLGKAGFELRKWCSNSEDLLKFIREGSNQETGNLELKIDSVMKILGLTWNRRSDVFEYSVQLPPPCEPITKRKVLSDVARLFDPLGWIAPTIITAKVFIQKLWISGIDWDDELPPQLLKEWLAYRCELAILTDVRIPRWINSKADDQLMELHGFSDASTVAYAAVVYARIINRDGERHVHLLTSKTKVAPVKQVSIPRLELCGAVLLTKLLLEVASVLQITKENIHAWTDSLVVLAWLKGHPSRWKTFIANRVSEILTVLDSTQWSHVPSKDNPADCASRGLRPHDYPNELWNTGPHWLKYEKIIYNRQKVEETNLEEKTKKVCHTTITGEFDLWERYSTLRKLVRVIAFCRKFLRPRSNQKSVKKKIFISGQEYTEALNTCIRQCQVLHLHEDLDNLTKTGKVNKKSRLTSLNPFVDEVGIMRVGGRLHGSQMSEERKHPILIPRKSHFTNLLIAEAHERTLHGGPQLMINYLRTKYWIVDVKNLAKFYVRRCVSCIRYGSRTKHQLMGQLPSARATACRPFFRSGVDFAGPINVRTTKGRGHRACKGYICLFVCMATRAVHLEAVSDLTTQGFLAAFKRFVARRGHCADIWSDNGTNFTGAARELKSLFFAERSGIAPDIVDSLANNGTVWHFIPPRSPNFGGLWEAGIKSTKHHLQRIIGNATLTYEEMATVLTQVEACLNSRPLSQISNNPGDPAPLTPGHFLVGEPLVLVPDVNYEASNLSNLKRWQLTQKMLQHFWRRWSQDYLTQFFHRRKWQELVPGPEIGDVVLIREDDLPPANWLFGIVIDKHEGLDKITRVVSLKCNGKVIKRPVSKVCVLPVAE